MKKQQHQKTALLNFSSLNGDGNGNDYVITKYNFSFLLKFG